MTEFKIKVLEQTIRAAAIGLGIVLGLSLFTPKADAQNYPCSGMKGVVSYCEGGKFICNDGSMSQSRQVCVQGD